MYWFFQWEKEDSGKSRLFLLKWQIDILIIIICMLSIYIIFFLAKIKYRIFHTYLVWIFVLLTHVYVILQHLLFYLRFYVKVSWHWTNTGCVDVLVLLGNFLWNILVHSSMETLWYIFDPILIPIVIPPMNVDMTLLNTNTDSEN